MVVHDPGEHSWPATNVQMNNPEVGGVETQLRKGAGERAMIILVPEVWLGVLDNVLAGISDYLSQGVVGTYLGGRRLFATSLRYGVEGRYVVVSY